MYKIIAIWSAPKPADVDAFETYYQEVHVPLAARAPGLRKLVLTRTPDGLEGGTPGFHRAAELHFDDVESLRRSARSAAWQSMREDAGKMIERFGVTLTVAMGREEEYPLPRS
ncbi:MAG: EthD family reductase [Candidatus Binatia bacterium]